MTTYIEHEVAAPAAANPGELATPASPLNLINPFSEALPGLIALWSLPLTAFQIWSHGWASIIGRDAPAVATSHDEAQLPLPTVARSSFA